MWGKNQDTDIKIGQEITWVYSTVIRIQNSKIGDQKYKNWFLNFLDSKIKNFRLKIKNFKFR